MLEYFAADFDMPGTFVYLKFDKIIFIHWV